MPKKLASASAAAAGCPPGVSASATTGAQSFTNFAALYLSIRSLESLGVGRRSMLVQGYPIEASCDGSQLPDDV
jgi:hypothetical protein